VREEVPGTTIDSLSCHPERSEGSLGSATKFLRIARNDIWGFDIMILNIVDRRKHAYRWKKVNAIIEPTWHDNSIANSDQAEVRHEDPEYEQREGVSVVDAVQWASALSFGVTLYLYDSAMGHAF
jgi:hypothetical protein